MKSQNIILTTDAYKQTHWLQYPPKTERVYSYLESRGGRFDETVFFGLQYYLKAYLEGVVVEPWMIDEAEDFCQKLFGADYFNRAGWDYIVREHNGRLPLRIKAVPEGAVVPFRNVLTTVENTDDNVPFLTNFIETLLMKVWYPITVCTNSWQIKQRIKQHAEKTGADWDPFFLNDFGFRGVSSSESAGIGGMAHLVNFLGTDTLAGIEYAMRYYDTDVCGFSVMAAEHSTVTSWGRDNELDAYKHFIEQFPTGLMSVVSDSFDIYYAVDQFFGVELKDEILARDGKFVVRPDSGDPPSMSVDVLNLLWDRFGGTINDKGYRALNPKIGMIYGDGIDYDSIGDILEAVSNAGFSIGNLVFGMGGALLQKLDRDTHKFAFKASSVKIDGVWRDVYKDPVTDSGKSSKRGRLKLVRALDGEYETADFSDPRPDEMVTVFENGEVLQEYSFDEVRARSEMVKEELVFA
ncbi:MAG: nicotinate phosphoribosyltransferase [Chloroflexota bacterium]